MSKSIIVAAGIAGMLIAFTPLFCQEPAQYQVIRVNFRVTDRNGKPLPNASLLARLDPSSGRPAPDRVLKARLGGEEYIYSIDEPDYVIFSNQQYADQDGIVSLPVIVYANRPDPIDYELNGMYGQERANRVPPNSRKRSFSAADIGATMPLAFDVVGDVPASNYLVALGIWIAAAVMGSLLFFRGVYRYLLASGRSIEISQALCWSGSLFVAVAALGLLYWLLLPHVVNVYIVLGFLLAVWLAHLLFTVLPRRA
jgi:hypothetical protein